MYTKKEVTFIDDVLTKEENLALLNKLCYHQWYLTQCKDYGSLIGPLFSGRSGGFSVETLKDGKPFDSPLNKEAYKITKKVCDTLEIKKYKIIRFLWNMYFQRNHTDYHQDEYTEDYLSILYNPHTTDGGTFVNNIFHVDKMGQAKVYKSMVEHRGNPPSKDAIRFNLNVLIKCFK
jgi:hypothetical protein